MTSRKEDKKSVSTIRFQQVNHMVDRVVRHLPPSHALILLIGWRHADTKAKFRLSETRFAEQSGMSIRHVKTIIHNLIEAGALKVLQPGIGTRATLYKITGEPQK